MDLRQGSARARWDRFGHPATMPKYGNCRRFRRIWWWDADKAAKAAARSSVECGSAAASRLARRPPARSRPSWVPSPLLPPARAQEGGRASRHVGLRRPQISARLQAFRLRQSGRAQGGILDVAHTRQFNQNFFTFDSLNAFILKGDAAQGIDLTFATLMGPPPPRARRHLRLTARGENLRRRADLPLPAAAASPVPRRQPPHRAGRRLLAAFAEAEGPPQHPAAAARAPRRRSGRRRTVVVRFAPNRGRDVPLFVAQLPIFSRAYYATRRSTNRPSMCRSAPAPTRSAVSRSAATSNTSASRTGGAPICRSAAGSTISTSCGSSSTATATSPSRASPPRTICSARSSPRGSGRRATPFRPSRTAASSARCCRTRRPPARRAGSSTPGASSSRTRGCAKRFDAFDFE